MTNSYLFALVDGGGTVPPELGAARRLVERGHRVTVLADDSMRDDVLAAGATFRAWEQAPNKPSRRPEDERYDDWNIKNPLGMVPMLLEQQFAGPAPGYAADVAAALTEAPADLVVCSMFAYGALVAAEAAGVPFDVLLPNAYLLPAPGMPPMGMGLRPARSVLGRARDRAVNGLTGLQWRKGVAPLNELRATYGLAPLTGFFEQVHRARRILVLTSADFDFPAELPANVRYVGAVLDDPAWAAAPWSPPAGEDPLVLVALSSTFQDQIGCLQRIVDGLATLPVRVVVTTGPAVEPAAVRTPANATVVAAAPHSEVLRHAAAVVTHGGHGTVVRALAADVPLVVMHHGRDQADNAARVTSRGAGLAVKRTASPGAAAAAVRRLLEEPSHRAGARRLGGSIRRDAASGALVAELEDLPAVAAGRWSPSLQY